MHGADAAVREEVRNAARSLLVRWPWGKMGVRGRSSAEPLRLL
jgi:hypothetical protein